MAARWQIEVPQAKRQLRLLDNNLCRFELPFDQGGRYRLIVPDLTDLRAIMGAIESASDAVTVLPANGGLLGAATVAENFSIALHYATDPRDKVATEWEDALQQALQLAGMAPDRIARIGREQPMHLPRPERLLLGMVRHILRPPEVLVFDHVFATLTRREAEAFISLDTLFHTYHPFRPTLFVDLDTHGLPDLPGCRQEIRLDTESTCLC